MPTRKLLPLLFWALLTASAVAADTPALSPEVQSGLEAASRIGIAQPPVAPSIYIDTVAAHHTHDEQILLAWRGADGRWRMAGGLESTGLLVRMEPSREARPVVTLSLDDSLTLDRLLASKSLYREGSPKTPELGVGAAFSTLEVVAPQGHLVIRWAGMRLRGKAGKIADIMMGHD